MGQKHLGQLIQPAGLGLVRSKNVNFSDAPQVIPMHATLRGPQPCKPEADASTTSHWFLEASSEQMLKDPSSSNAGPESRLHVCTPCTVNYQFTLLWMGVAGKMNRDSSCPVHPTVQSYNLNEPGLPSLLQHLLFIFLFIPQIFCEYCVCQNLFYDKQGGWGLPPLDSWYFSVD